MGFGSWLGDHWDDVLVGAVSVGSCFVPGGPLVVALVGGGVGALTGGLTSWAQGESPLVGAATGGIGGVLPGGVRLGKVAWVKILGRELSEPTAVAAKGIFKNIVTYGSLGYGFHSSLFDNKSKLTEYGPIATVDISKPLGNLGEVVSA